MYEQFRNELSCLLISKYGSGEVNDIMGMVDMVSSRYSFDIAETALIPYEYTVPVPLELYIASKRLEGKSEGTLENYGILLNIFFKTVGKAVADVTTNDIRMFLYAYQAQKGVSNRTLDKYKDYITSFFAWAENEGYTDINPALKIPKIKYEQRERKALTQTELEYIRGGCADLRDKALIELLYSTGCRVSEVSGIKLSDIDWSNKSIKVLGKGKKERTVFINARAEVAIRKYLDGRGHESEYLICSRKAPHGNCGAAAIQKMVRAICERAGVGAVSPHIFRHTTATTALSNGMGIENISRMLGHASVSTTMIYAKTNDTILHQEHARCVI